MFFLLVIACYYILHVHVVEEERLGTLRTYEAKRPSKVYGECALGLPDKL